MMAELPNDQEVAAALADEVRGSADRRTWRKVTTLLDKFNTYRLTGAARQRIGAALDDAGLVCDPPLDEVERYGTVRLALASAVGHPLPAAPRSPGQAPPAIAGGERSSHSFVGQSDGGRSPMAQATTGPSLQISLWNTGSTPQELDLDAACQSDGPLWIDVPADTDPRAAHRALEEICGGEISFELVADLVAVDAEPGVKREDELRLISAFAAEVKESDEGPDLAGAAGDLIFWPVEFLAGDTWVAACWHEGSVFRGGQECDRRASRLRYQVMNEVKTAWQRGSLSGAHSIGALVLSELVSSYAAVRRDLYSRLEQWELAFYKLADRDEPDRRTLRDLRGQAAEFRHRLSLFNQPGVKDEEAWFLARKEDGIAARTDDHVDRALRDLQEFGAAIRSSFDVVSSSIAADQLKLARKAQEEGEELRKRIEIIAAVLLVPALIAGIYGANTQLPGGGQWIGFGLMLGVMVVFGLMTLAVLRRFDGKDD